MVLSAGPTENEVKHQANNIQPPVHPSQHAMRAFACSQTKQLLQVHMHTHMHARIGGFVRSGELDVEAERGEPKKKTKMVREGQ